MKPEVKEHLIAGLIQYLSAESSGSSRFAVADGYLAIDNYFSAILLDKEIDPTRNHKQKLNLMLLHCGDVLQKAKVTKDDLEEFYNYWQKVRYSSTILTPGKTFYFLRLSYRIISTFLEEIAIRNGKSYEELEEELYTEIIGNRWSSFDEEISNIHAMWQWEAEDLGEMGIGSKLGNKMLNPSNFCEICVLADDKITKEIIAKDSEFGAKIADFYHSFLKLINYVQMARHKRGVEPNEITNFMLSLRIRYHGQTIKEIADHWMKMIAEVEKSVEKELTENQNSEDDNGI